MKLTQSLNTWRRARRTAHELGKLSEHNLEDLGLSRGDINDVALKSARGDAI